MECELKQSWDLFKKKNWGMFSEAIVLVLKSDLWNANKLTNSGM